GSAGKARNRRRFQRHISAVPEPAGTICAGPETENHRMRKPLWTYLACCIAVFMISMDNLIVTNALPVIRQALHTGLEGLEWMVNAYTMTFAVLLLTGAALGDRFGRRRLLIIGVAVFTAGSAASALAPS